MSCVWLRLYEVTGDFRYLNAALKMNEMLKQLIPVRGRRGIAGGVGGSYPVWGRYQALRYISWGCKFLADSLLLNGAYCKALRRPNRGVTMRIVVLGSAFTANQLRHRGASR